MPTVIAHPAVALALGPFFAPAGVTPRWWLAGAACTIVPDLDVIGLRLGIPYGHVLGHRGVTHSLAFAAALGIAVVAMSGRGRRDPRPGALFAYLFLCTASHGVLDAFTNGGRGVAFLAPFSAARAFWPWRPIEVSPLGVDAFLGTRGAAVLRSEAIWVGLPCALLFLVGALACRRRVGARAPSGV